MVAIVQSGVQPRGQRRRKARTNRGPCTVSALAVGRSRAMLPLPDCLSTSTHDRNAVIAPPWSTCSLSIDSPSCNSRTHQEGPPPRINLRGTAPVVILRRCHIHFLFPSLQMENAKELRCGVDSYTRCCSFPRPQSCCRILRSFSDTPLILPAPRTPIVLLPEEKIPGLRTRTVASTMI